MLSLGLTEADVDSGAFEVWPDNLPAMNVLIAMSTQWRTGVGGATGLDYNVLPAVFRLQNIPRRDWPDTFECVRLMERESLLLMGDSP